MKTQSYWSLSPEEVLKLLKTSKTGLSDEEVRKRLEKFGKNTIKLKKVRAHVIFLRQFTDSIMLVLVFSSVILYLMNNLLESAVVALIIFASALLGFLQEWKAEKIIESLQRLMTYKVKVKRSGKIKVVDSSEIVPGDVIILEPGMRVPADARVIEAKELFINEAVLTGESEAVEKTVDTVKENAILPERKNMVYAGTIVVSGNGLAVVVDTGEKTEIGRISKLVKKEERIQTPLIAKMKRMGKRLSVAILAVSLLNFLVGMIRGYDPLYTLLASISLAVAAIPEALPALVTVSLALGVKEMAARNVLIRKLPAVETLGSVTVICTDKTGTITQNKMKVVRITTRSGSYSAEELNNLSEDLKLILTAGYVCNKATYQVKDGKIFFHGDPTDIALLEVALKNGITPDYETIDEIPFDSRRKFMAVLSEVNGKKYIFVKGAPEVISKMCNVEISTAEICASMGARVIAFAYKDVEEFGGFDFEDMKFLGYVCLMDPLREDSRQSILACKEAGIRVVMITGDHPLTAKAIARAAGIEGEVIDGSELEKMDVKKAIKKYNVFARVSPEQKLEIVKALQEEGEIVAVTGDGVNDAPALKRADIGIAMGEGEDVAKEASDMILLDNAFSSIVKAVEVGRDVFRKIQRILCWILPTNGGQAGIVLTAFALGIPLPMKPLHILWVNTVTAALLGTMIVFDKPEKGLLRLKPSKGELLNKVLAFRILYISLISILLAYLLYFKTGKMSAAMNTVIAVGMWYLLTPHPDKSFFNVNLNPFAFLGIFSTLVLQILVTNFASSILLEPLEISEWIAVLLLASIVFWIVELEKLIRRA